VLEQRHGASGFAKLKEENVKASHRIGTGLLVGASATVLVVGLNAGSSAAPRAVTPHPVSLGHLARSVQSARQAATSSAGTHTFIAGKRGLVVRSGQAIWTVPVKPGLYEVSFKAILNLSQPNPPQPGEVICGALDLKTLSNRVPWIYTVDSADYFGQIPAAMSGSATIPVRPGAQPGMLCISPSGRFQMLSPVVATFTKVTSRHVSRAKRLTAAPKVLRGIRQLFRG
jgi:hypothetical protein